MLITQAQTVKEAFPFIRQILTDAFKVDAYYFSYPYQGLEQIDKGFREMVWADFSNENDGRWDVHNQTLADRHQFFLVESVLGFYNLFAFTTPGENPDFITIGPFCTHSITDSFFKKIIASAPVLQGHVPVLKQFYESLPVVDPDELTAMTSHLVGAFLPQFESAPLKFIRYSKNERFFTENETQVYVFSSEMAENFTKELQALLELIERGHAREAWARMQKLLSSRHISDMTPASKLKTELAGFNTLFFGRMLDTHIPAFSICRLWHTMSQRIQFETKGIALYKLFHEMVRKYCLLSQNHANSECSLLTRKIRLYVEEHFAESLSLQVLADNLGKNASYLSALFKKETGQTVTEYIQKERVRAAVRLFNEGATSVTQVASAVGIPDCCRFSRVFKKYTDITPSQYRKMMRM